MSSSAGDWPMRFRFHAAKRLSSEWQSDSTSVKLTERAAPLRLCTSRKIRSTTAERCSSAAARSRVSSSAEIVWRCSAASVRNIASSVFWNSSFLPAIVSMRRVSEHGAELPPEVVQVLRGDLGLLRSRGVLDAGLLDVLHRQRHLIHAHHLLLARGGDPYGRLLGLGHGVGELADRV